MAVPNVVQVNSRFIYDLPTGTSQGLAFVGGDNVVGNCIVVILGVYQYRAKPALVQVSDDNGNVYSLLGISPSDATNWAPDTSPQSYIFLAPNIAAGPNTVHVSNTGAPSDQDFDVDWIQYEVGGASTTPFGGLVQTTHSENLGNGDPCTTGTLTTDHTDELLISYAYDWENQSTSFTPDTGWTTDAQTNNDDFENLISASMDAPTIGAYSDVFTFINGFLQTASAGIVAILKTGDVGSTSASASPSTLNFIALIGGATPASQSVALTSDATTFSISSDQAWLTASPSSGSSPGSFDVFVDQTGLGSGTHSGNLTVTVVGAPNSPLNITVSVRVASSLLTVSPSTLSFSDIRFNTVAPQTVLVTAAGANISVSTSDSWLIVDGVGSVEGDDSISLTVTVDSSIAVGVHTAQIILDARNNTDHTTAAGSPSYVTVTFTVEVSADTVLPSNSHYKQSRFPAMTRVEYPLIPPQPPSYTVNGNDYTFALPPDNRDVFGILIQGRRTSVTYLSTSGVIALSASIADKRQFKVVGQDIKGNYLEEILHMGAPNFTFTRTTKPFAYILWVDVYYGTILNEVPVLFPDGVTTTFTVDKQIVPGSETVYVNGNPQVPTTPDVMGDYTVAGNAITFTGGVPPEDGSGLLVSYIYEIVTDSTVTISFYNGATVTGILEPHALQWLANRILYRYESLTLSQFPQPQPGTALLLGSPIVSPVLHDPGLTYHFVGACENAVGPYVGPDNPDPAELLGAAPSFQNAPSSFINGLPLGIEMHGYICPDFLYVYYYNLLDEMCAPYIVKLRSPTGDVLNVRNDFGAVGDGVFDDTAAVQCALDRAHENWLEAQAVAIGSPPLDPAVIQKKIGPSVVLIPSGINCLVGHAPIVQDVPRINGSMIEPTPYNYTMQKNRLATSSDTGTRPGNFGGWAADQPSNVGSFALQIKSGVTLIIEGQLTLVRPPQRITAWLGYASWSRRLLAGINVHAVTIKGSGLIELNGVPFTDFSSYSGYGAISLHGYDLRVEDIRIQNTGWETNLAKVGSYFEGQAFNDAGELIPIREYFTPRTAANAIGVELYQENKQTVIRNVTVDGSTAVPTRFQCLASVLYPYGLNVAPDFVLPGPIQGWGFEAAILIGPDSIASKHFPLSSGKPDGDQNFFEYWTGVDVKNPTGLLIENNSLRHCLFGVLAESDNYTAKNNYITACWMGVYLTGGKRVAVNENIIGWDDTPIMQPGGTGPTYAVPPSLTGGLNLFDFAGPTHARPVGILLSVAPSAALISEPPIVGEASNGLGRYSGRLMSCRVFGNHATGLEIGIGIDSYFVGGTPDVSGRRYPETGPGNLGTARYMADVEIFGNSCNNNWKGFSLSADGPVPYQRINLHDNQARRNSAYRDALFQGPIGVGGGVAVPAVGLTTALAGGQQIITGWAIRGADFPAWEELDLGWTLGKQKGNFLVPDENRPRGLSWNNPAIRNEYVIDGWVFRHWDFVNNHYPAGIIDGVNREYLLPESPEINFPYAKVVQQFTFTQQRAGEMYFDFVTPAVQDAPPGGAVGNSLDAFPQPRDFKNMQFIGDVLESRFGGGLGAGGGGVIAILWGNAAKRIIFFGPQPNSAGLPQGLHPPPIETPSEAHENDPTKGKMSFRVNYKYIAGQSQGYVIGGWSEFGGFETGWTPGSDPPPPAPDEDPEE